MVDLDFFEKLLKNDCGYIEEGDTITEDFIERMKKYSTTKVMRLFKKSQLISNNKGKVRFEVNLNYICKECGKECVDTVTKTFVSKILNGTEKLICEECKEKIKIEKEKRMRIDEIKLKELNEKAIVENTNNYIEFYLNADMNWNKGVKIWKKLNEIKKINCCDKDIIADYIKAMPYSIFLQTLYWKTIAEKVRIESKYKCKICNSSNHLSVHHRTYRNHGYELDHMEDLVCICQECHSKFHNIEEEK